MMHQTLKYRPSMTSQLQILDQHLILNSQQSVAKLGEVILRQI